MTSAATGYDHTQRGPLGWMLGLVALAAAFAAGASYDRPLDLALMLGVAAILGFAAACFGRMTVRDEGRHLVIRFGPLPVFRKRIPYAEITAAEPGKSALIDGLGIHCIPGRGCTYNLWGRDCATLTVKGRTVRVGSDDVDGLVEFLRGRLGAGESGS
jgi:hypothetical protein